MIKLLGSLPRNKTISIAFSGGVDSVVALDFISRRHDVEILYCNHGSADPTANQMGHFAQQMGDLYGCEVITGNNHYDKKPEESLEEYWRNCRYEWFDTMPDKFIVTGHHLDDCVETWVWSSMHGTPKTIPYKRNENVYRPFLLNKKSELEAWQEKNNLVYMKDPMNSDNKRTRNYIRNVMMPHCLHVNPGLHKVVKKKVLIDSEKHLTCDGDSYIS